MKFLHCYLLKIVYYKGWLLANLYDVRSSPPYVHREAVLTDTYLQNLNFPTTSGCTQTGNMCVNLMHHMYEWCIFMVLSLHIVCAMTHQLICI